MTRILQIVFGTFLFVFPFSIRFLVYEEAAYRFGNFNPWVSEFVYAPELFLILAFGIWLFKMIKCEKLKIKLNSFLFLALLFLANALIVSFWKGNGALGLFLVWRIVEILMVYYLIRDEVLPRSVMVKILFGGALFQLILGFLQWQLNQSIGLWWLGEPILGPDVLNVAKVGLAEGLKQIRPYGTLLHPNILAAYFLMILAVTLPLLKAPSQFVWLFLLAVGIYLTKSAAALGVLGVVLILWVFKRWYRPLVWLIMLALLMGSTWFFFNSQNMQMENPSYQERLDQNVISRKMLSAHPLGVGVRNFTIEMENFSERQLKPWEFQPVHNTYFLILNETGIQGLLLFLGILFLWIGRAWYNEKTLPLIALFLLAPFDHFLWDSWVGMMLIALAIGFFTVRLQNQGPALRP